MGRTTQHNELLSMKHSEHQINLQQFGMQQDDERIILLSGDISESSIAMASTALLSMANRDRHRPIHMIINTYGGSIDEMYCMYDVMKYVKTPIYTVGLGKIMSAGVLLLAAGTKGKRLIGQNARVMIHSISSGVFGNVFEIMSYAEEVERMQKKYEACLVSETKLETESLNNLMKKTIDQYMTSSDVVKFGIADHIIG